MAICNNVAAQLPPKILSGAGLGLRRAIIGPLLQLEPGQVDFMEAAPENWMNVGGRYGKQFRELAERFPVALHGLSLNLGGYTAIDVALVKSVKQFMAGFNCPYYSEHLSYCADAGHLYDLMPIPFTDDAVKVVVARIRQVQDILERRIAVENVSYYAAPGQQISEIDFINAVILEADCDFLLDVNNIFVNSINHGYNAADFLKALPGERVTYIHIAGHFVQAPDLCVDTHGSAVVDDVWNLLAMAYQQFGVLPTLLERDFNFPAMPVLLDEVERIRRIQAEYAQEVNDATGKVTAC